MAAVALLKIPDSLRNGWLQLLSWNRETIYLKTCSLRLNAVTYKRKSCSFRNNYFGSQPFLMSCYFTTIFINLSLIAAVCYFSVSKLIGWDPENIYLFKVNSRNTRKRYGICPKLTINTIESRSDVFILNFEVFLLLTLNR